LNSTNNWTYKWENVEKGYFYYVKELDVPDGYTVSYSGNGLSTIGMIVISNTNNTTVVTTTTTTGTATTTTTASGESTTTTETTTTEETTTTTTVQTTTTTAPATTTTAAATTTQGIRIGVHKVWSDLATNSHDSDTVVVEIHRSTNPADVPDQAKITTTAVTTTTTATVTTTGKSPPSGNTVQLDNVAFGKEVNLSAYDYTNITEIALKLSATASDGEGQIVIPPNYHQFPFSKVESDGLIHVKLDAPSSPILKIEKFHSSSTFTLESVILYFNTTSQQGMDSIKPVLAAANGSSSPTWVQNLEIRKDTGWTATAENLPATDADGNPYYYWVVEKDFSGYDASYLYENSPGDKYITGKDGSITVCNTPSKTTSVVMPSTGGSGTFFYRFIGISLMTAAAGFFVLRRRKQYRSSA